ncbi:MAG: hypothetical protein EA412_07170 [Chitinophagaceae bacterium]|nr:MAG: hypothetical protein EA412_07170 [Chitinophagaceae bacterium]
MLIHQSGQARNKGSKRFFYLIVFFFFSTTIIGFSRPIGSWNVHVPHQNAYSLAIDNEYVYCATSIFFFSHGKSDRANKLFDKNSGLADTDVTILKYHEELEKLIIIYENSNIDILKNGRFTNVSDILRANILGDKRILNVTIKEEIAYLSTAFGIVLLDLESYEIADTYYIGEDGDPLRVNNVSFLEDTIYAATSQGIRKAPLDAPILANFQFWSWEPHTGDLMPGEVQNIITYDNRLFAMLNNRLLKKGSSGWEIVFDEANWRTNRMRISNNKLILPQEKIDNEDVIDSRILVYDTDLDGLIYTNNSIVRPSDALFDESGVLWVADVFRGLVRLSPNSVSQIRPNSPGTSRVFRMSSRNGRTYVAPGGANLSWNYTFNRDGFLEYTGNWWNSYNRFNRPILDTVFNIINLAPNPNNEKEIYFASFYNGLIRWKNDELSIYSQYNSPLQAALGDALRTNITGLAFDRNGNLWISNFLAPDPVAVKTADDKWFNFRPPGGINTLTDVIVDSRNQKWFIVSRSNTHGLFVFSENGDLENNSNNQSRLLGTGSGNGNLPSADVLSIAEDKEGRIWVGTAEGVAVFFCAGQVLSDQGCDAQQITTVVDGFAGYLFEAERVNAIAVDGANRKWVGTNNGIFLVSADGTEEIHHFTVNNSPLLSNVITSISIQDSNGEVFIGTDKGIVSYKSDATGGGETHENVLVYPNPVRPEYSGPIAIKGLVNNADVRITDVNGMLVYQTRALGGQAIWDGNRLNGGQAKSGVYLVFSTNSTGEETMVSKIFFVR